MTPLTKRQCEVLALLAAGEGRKTIAHRLGVTPKTLDQHFINLRRRLDARSTAQALAIAIRSGAV